MCGLPGALSLIVMVPFRGPRAIGLNVTSILHEAFTASELPQLFVAVKSLSPAMLMMINATSPGFVSTMLLAELLVPTSRLSKANSRVVKLTDGAKAVPERAIVASSPLVLLCIVMRPDRDPPIVGANRTVIEHEAPAGMPVLVRQVLLTAKSPLT